MCCPQDRTLQPALGPGYSFSLKQTVRKTLQGKLEVILKAWQSEPLHTLRIQLADASVDALDRENEYL